jgi:hypothetical protein
MENSFYLVSFKERYQFEKIITAKSHGQAKYIYWLSFSDSYDISFGEFLKISRCRKFN